MKVAVVVDVGNTRIKWGRCQGDRVAESVSLPPEDAGSWTRQLERWALDRPLDWVVSGVHPQRRDTLVEWLRNQGQRVMVLESPDQLPLEVLVERPERVGIDRLLNAVAANRRRQSGIPGVIVDAGSAVTVDWLNEQGAFCGGAIFPGVRLMAQALHEYTALLPLVEFRDTTLTLPGKSTRAAIEAGIYWAVAGGVRCLVGEMSVAAQPSRQVWLTGGDAQLLRRTLDGEVTVWPDMTLEGIRLSADRLS
jgi:type III pantothenate kinase